ncbi:hypothetical protein WJX72_004350 [[Myrmecia] bisecta]|uniref:Retrotransposon gag domain-containing protein n=1 Tax=[Myrmecia] bisecta TaxID=41462 RepID=A0AAW1R5Y6_9CHLO
MATTHVFAAPTLHIEKFQGLPGDYPQVWLDGLNDNAELYHWDDSYTLKLARAHMAGTAYTWLSANRRKLTNWDSFEQLFLERFGDDDVATAALISTRSQYRDESVNDYSDSLQALFDRVESYGEIVPTSLQVVLFTRGLRPDIKEKVLARRPQNLQAAISEAVS